ncbi:flagellar protein FlaG [Desulfovulcanus sp.]
MKVQDILNINQEATSFLSAQKNKPSPQEEIEAPTKKNNLDLEKIEKLSRSIENYINSIGVELKFHIHKETDKIQVDVIDPEKNKIIRKVPPDELLKLAASIEKMVGVFMEVSA